MLLANVLHEGNLNIWVMVQRFKVEGSNVGYEDKQHVLFWGQRSWFEEGTYKETLYSQKQATRSKIQRSRSQVVVLSCCSDGQGIKWREVNCNK